MDLRVVALPVRRQPRPDQSERASDRHSLTRPLTALLVLGLGVLGAMYVGKRYADTHVIIVPAPTNERSVIT